MRILVQNLDTKLFVRGDGWTADRHSAQDFQGTGVAFAFCTKQPYPAQVVLDFRDVVVGTDFHVHMPLEHVRETNQLMGDDGPSR